MTCALASVRTVFGGALQGRKFLLKLAFESGSADLASWGSIDGCDDPWLREERK